MRLSFSYSVLQVVPERTRDERVNIGLVIFLGESLDIELLPSFTKVRALTDKIHPAALRELSAVLNNWVDFSSSPEEQARSICGLGYLDCSVPGTFVLSSPADYEDMKRRLFNEHVLPVRLAAKKKNQDSSLFITVRSQFFNSGLLGRDDEDIGKHLLVPHFTIDQKSGLRADFALKNGCFHIIETIDLVGGDTSQKMREASLKAITLDRARKSFGGDTKGYVVFRSSDEEVFSHHLDLLTNYADHVVNFANANALGGFLEDIYSRAGRSYSLWSKTDAAS